MMRPHPHRGEGAFSQGLGLTLAGVAIAASVALFNGANSKSRVNDTIEFVEFTRRTTDFLFGHVAQDYSTLSARVLRDGGAYRWRWLHTNPDLLRHPFRGPVTAGPACPGAICWEVSLWDVPRNPCVILGTTDWRGYGVRVNGSGLVTDRALTLTEAQTQCTDRGNKVQLYFY